MIRLTTEQLDIGFQGRTVLREVTVAVSAGELLCVLGPNGVGKTTLLKTLAGLLRPLAGRVQLNGRNVAELPRRVVARELAFVPQLAVPEWPFTVAEFVGLGRSPHVGWWRPLGRTDRRVVADALDALQLGEFRHRPITALSGGEWQRVRLAAALAQEAPVVLFDEPTAHLDPTAQRDFLTHVRRFAVDRKGAVVLTVHDLNLAAAWANRVLLLAAGRQLALGPPADVLTTTDLTTAYGPGLAVVTNPADGGPLIRMLPPEESRFPG